MATIAYDQPVKDLIAGLDATGHVTHTSYRKTHVTLHHNGARLTHEGVLSVWQVRPASAHFDVDASGAVAQYVRASEYAWAVGDTLGNQCSISIEMCNETLAPSWRVGEATWRSAARLAGWLFANVIGARPTASTLVMHRAWSATDCAGPHIASIYGQILALAQEHYDRFTGAISEAPKIKERYVKLIKGDERPEIWVFEFGAAGIVKAHIPDEYILDVWRTLLGKTDEQGNLVKAEVEIKPQAYVDLIATYKN